MKLLQNNLLNNLKKKKQQKDLFKEIMIYLLEFYLLSEGKQKTKTKNNFK